MSWTHSRPAFSPQRKPRPSAVSQREKRVARESVYKRNSRLARERDGGHCRLCGSGTALETHHVIPRSLAGRKVRDSVANLLTLCGGPDSCHEQVTRHVIKLYVGERGADGPVRCEKWSDREGGYVLVRKAA